MENEYKNNSNKECKINRLKYFPISFLAICLGPIGFTLAWASAEHGVEIENEFEYCSVMLCNPALCKK